MKCPKCGFVSYAGLEKCKKCGYPFVKAAAKASASSLTAETPISSTTLTTLFPEGVRLGAQPRAEPPPPPLAPNRVSVPPDPPPQTSQPLVPVASRQPLPSVKRETPTPLPPRVDEPSPNWREELSERVGNYRKRRGHLRPESETRGNLELEFDYAEKPEEQRFIISPLAPSNERDLGFDLDISPTATLPDDDVLPHEPLAIGPADEEAVQFDTPTADAEEMSLGEPEEERSPMEILVGAPKEREDDDEEDTEGIFLAPLGRRLMAGLTDALVLLLGAAVFGVIVWRVCGRLSLVPLNIAVLGAAGVILIFAYFAVFTAIAAATPGLLWMGCEIRNLRGTFPTPAESMWRAFGVLVSASALMLGFVWACVDSDSLTWHDRMSNTVITEEHVASDLAGAKAET